MWFIHTYRAGRLSALFLLAAASASAQAGAPAAAPEVRCSQGSEPALSELACEVAAATRGLGDNTIVIAAPLRGLQVQAPESVTSRLTSLVAGAIGGNTRPFAQPLELPAARAQARGSKLLIFMTLELAVERISVTVDVYPVSFRFWDRVRNPTPGAIRHAFATRPLDPELRGLLPSVPIVISHIDKAAAPERDAIALACGDADGDGASEIVFVGRHRIALGRIRKAKFETHAKVTWSELSSVAQSPLREPIASAWIADAGLLEIGSTDRRDGFRFRNGFTNRVALARRLPWPGGGCTERDTLALAGRVTACDADPLRGPTFSEEIDALAGTRLIGRDGKRRTLWLARLATQQLVVATDDRGRKLELGNAGAQLAAGDLDGDGDPELVTTTNTLDPTQDVLSVRTWQSEGKVIERFSTKVPSGVRAIATCPLQGSSMAPVVIASSDGLWVIR